MAARLYIYLRIRTQRNGQLCLSVCLSLCFYAPVCLSPRLQQTTVHRAGAAGL